MRVAFMSEPRSASAIPKGNGAVVSILLYSHPLTTILCKPHGLLIPCDCMVSALSTCHSATFAQLQANRGLLFKKGNMWMPLCL